MRTATTCLVVLLSSALLVDGARAQETDSVKRTSSADPSSELLHGTWTRDVGRTLEAIRERTELSEDLERAVRDVYEKSSLELTVHEDGSLEFVYSSMGKTKVYGGRWTVTSAGDGDLTARISDVAVIEEKSDEDDEYVSVSFELPKDPRLTLTRENELLLHGDAGEGPVPKVTVLTRK